MEQSFDLSPGYGFILARPRWGNGVKRKRPWLTLLWELVQKLLALHKLRFVSRNLAAF